jgi:hypothetical protein
MAPLEREEAALVTATNVVIFGSRPSGSLVRVRKSDLPRGSLLVPSSHPEVPSGT